MSEQVLTNFTPREKLGLAVEITASYFRARRWLRRYSVEKAAAAAREDGSPPTDASRADAYLVAFRLGRVVERGLNHLPGDTRCLTRSLVLLRLLERRGIEAKLVIGVKPQPFEAHAWVEYEGEPLLNPDGFAAGRLTEI